MKASEIRHAFGGAVFRLYGSRDSAALTAKELSRAIKYSYLVKSVKNTDGWLIVSENHMEIIDCAGILPFSATRMLKNMGSYFELVNFKSTIPA